MWAYFLLRYYQYLGAERGYRGAATSAHAMFRSRAIANVLMDSGREGLIGEVVIEKARYGWTYTIKEHEALGNGSVGELREQEKGRLPLMRSWWWKLHAYIHVALHTPKVTDHVLPFVPAIATPLVIAGRMIW